MKTADPILVVDDDPVCCPMAATLFALLAALTDAARADEVQA